MTKKEIIKRDKEATDEKDFGLIGRLYLSFPKSVYEELINRGVSRYFIELNGKNTSIKYENTRDYFMINWLNISCRDNYPYMFANRHWSNIAKSGKFIKKDMDGDIPLAEKIKLNGIQPFIESEESFEENFGSYLMVCKEIYEIVLGEKFDEDDFLDNLVDALENTECYYVTEKKGYKSYDANDKQRLINHINDDRELFSLPHFIRHYIRFALYKTVPEDFSVNERTINDLQEFSECSIRKFGTTSKHGIMEIIRLAEREEKPNIIAMCEYADILYYGQVDGIEQNIPEAFRLYKKAAGIDDENSELHKNAYPQALWSVGHIIFNYSNNRFNSALPKHDPIPEIEELDNLERIKLAYKRASQAYSISQLPAAANLLGQIAQLTDDDCNGIDEFKKKKRIKDAQFYFEIAKDGGWIYAFNNLALEELREMTNEIGCVQKRNIHIYNCLKNLHEAAIRYEPWAANTLGLYYLEGIKYRDPNTKKVKTIIDSEGVRTIGSDGTVANYDPSVNYKIINPYTNQEEIVDAIIDPDRAFFYFMKAYKAYHIFHDRYCGWACANLKSCFSERLSEEELIDIEAIINKYSHIDGILKTANKKRQLPTIKHKKLR